MSIDSPSGTHEQQPKQRWLNQARLLAYLGTILLTLQVMLMIYAEKHAWVVHGQPGGFDFQTFWAASRLWLEGTPLQAYSERAIIQAGQQIGPHVVETGPWRYPPNFLLLVRPLALLPCPVSYLIFITVTTAGLMVLLHKVLRAPDTLVWLLAFPGLWLNAIQGQNGSLTACFALGALLLLHKNRPVLAGICIGMLSIKPHLAVLFPLALACAEMWTAFFAAAVTAAVFTGLSIAVFGVAVIPAFLHGMGEANTNLANGSLPWTQMASLFASLRELHIAAKPAYVAQICQAVIAICAVAWVWRKSREWEVRATALVAGSFMISPYIYNYDAAWLAIPLALMTAKALRDGWLRGERLILSIAFIYPQSGYAIDFSLWHVGFGPLVLAALLFLAIRRTYVQASIGLSDHPAVSTQH